MGHMIEILQFVAGATIGVLVAANVTIVAAKLSRHDSFARKVQTILYPYARLLRMGGDIGRGRI